MKFNSKEDAQLFLTEINRIDLISTVKEDFVPSDEMIEEFIKRRKKLVPGLRNFRKSQQTKQQWRKNRFKMLRGIRRFHKSTKGKRFHRALGKFIATRDFSDKTLLGKRKPNREEAYNFHEVSDILKLLSSIRTHTWIEFDYYLPLQEMVDWQIFAEEMVPEIDRIEVSLIRHGDVINLKEELDFLFRLCDEKVLFDELEKVLGSSFEDIQNWWESQRPKLDEAGAFLQLINKCKEIFRCSDSNTGTP